MDETYISWNITNWITIVLMVVLGFALLALGAQAVKAISGGKISMTPTGMNNSPPVS